MTDLARQRAPARTHAPRRAREDRVEEILRTARDLFGERGYESTTVAEIAERIGVVEGLVYKYFPTKRALLLEVLGHWYEELFGDYTREIAGLDGCRNRLRYLVWRHLCTVRDDPRLCALMFREVLSAEHDYRGSPLHALNRRYTRLLLETLDAGVRAGEFRGDLPPKLVRSLVYGGIQHETSGYVANFIGRHTRHAPPECSRARLHVDALADQITTLLCDGLRPAPAQASTETPA